MLGLSKTFDNIHRENKAAGKPICSNPSVSGPEMEAYCVSCTSSPPTPITGPPVPVQSVASTSLVPVSSSPTLTFTPSPSPSPTYAPVLPTFLPVSYDSSSPYYHYLPHMVLCISIPHSPLYSVPVGRPGTAQCSMDPVPLRVFSSPSVTGSKSSIFPEPSAHVSAVVSDYQDLYLPRYYDLPSSSPTESTQHVAALLFFFSYLS